MGEHVRKPGVMASKVINSPKRMKTARTGWSAMKLKIGLRESCMAGSPRSQALPGTALSAGSASPSHLARRPIVQDARQSLASYVPGRPGTQVTVTLENTRHLHRPRVHAGTRLPDSAVIVPMAMPQNMADSGMQTPGKADPKRQAAESPVEERIRACRRQKTGQGADQDRLAENQKHDLIRRILTPS